MSDELDRDEILGRVVAALERGFTKASHGAAVANDLFLLREALGLAADPTVQRLVDTWRVRVNAARPDLLDTRIAYFLRLVRYPAPLLGEDVLKLMSLGEDIHALQSLGVPTPPGAMAECEAALREKLAEQPDIRGVASDFVRPWLSQIWCYRVLDARWGI